MHNWNYNPAVARSKLCRLIVRLDLPLGIDETDAFENYIVHAHNPRFVKSSRRTTTRDLGKLFNERREQHAAADNKELEEAFKNLYLEEDDGGAAVAGD